MRWRHLLRCCLPALWVGAWAAAALWLTAGQVRAMELPAGPALVLELLVWFAALIAALYYAPSYLRPVSIKWALTNIPFEVLGMPGRYMRKGCKWLSRETGGLLTSIPEQSYSAYHSLLCGRPL